MAAWASSTSSSLEIPSSCGFSGVVSDPSLIRRRFLDELDGGVLDTLSDESSELGSAGRFSGAMTLSMRRLDRASQDDCGVACSRLNAHSGGAGLAVVNVEFALTRNAFLPDLT